MSDRRWAKTFEGRALQMAAFSTTLIFAGSTVFFWYQRYDIPLAVLISGAVVFLTWLCLFFTRRSDKPFVKIDIALIFIRLIIIVGLAVLFALLEFNKGIRIISSIALVVSYLAISVLTLLVAMFKKGEEDV